MSFSYVILKDWQDPDAALSEASGYGGLSAGEKLILCSDGSLTLHLEAIYGAKVEVELERSVGATLDAETAGSLGEETGSSATLRDVWLRVKGERLVYAHSVIPEGKIEKWLKDSLDSGEPLGRALEKAEIPVLKTGLKIGVIRAEKVAQGFGLAPDALLFARRYRLSHKKNDGWIIKAQVLEVYSPTLAKAF